ncbi:MAG: hypothetical protein WD875_05175 [Pirellulales bacterium]
MNEPVGHLTPANIHYRWMHRKICVTKTIITRIVPVDFLAITPLRERLGNSTPVLIELPGDDID